MPKLSKPDHQHRVSQAEANRRRATALAGIRELELAQKTGLLLNKADVVATWTEIGTKFRDALSALPTRTVNRLPDEWKRQAHNVIDEEVRKALSDDIRPSKQNPGKPGKKGDRSNEQQ